MPKQFYDLIYFSDDCEWYADVFGSDGVALYTTEPYQTRGQAVADVMKHYPSAKLLRVFFGD